MVAALLGSFYVLAFVLSPYWTLLGSASNIVLFFLIIIGLGALWVFLCAARIELPQGASIWILLGVAVILVAALNLRTVASVIPWRGDEPTFIARTRDLIRRLPSTSILLLSVAFVLVLGAVAVRSRWAMLVAGVVAVYSVIQLFHASRFDDIGATVLIRWPYVNYWLFAVAPLVARYLWDPNHELLYRIVPLLSAAAMVWLAQRRLVASGYGSVVLWGAGIATIPLLFYYSSVLYIDVLATLLMTVVAFQAKELLQRDFGVLRQTGAWLALVVLGFLKDTVIVFLGIFLLFRLVVAWRREAQAPGLSLRSRLIRFVRSEAPVVFCVLYPYLINTALRFYLLQQRTYTRSYSPNLANLLEPGFYGVMARSFVEQFGVFLPLFLWGALLLWRRKEYLAASFAIALFIGVPVFYGLDSNSASYIGYSRFNLFVLPAVLAGSVVSLEEISRWGKAAAGILACVAIVANLAISPINLDGTKKPYWGTYVFDTAEHYYPYDEATLWLKNHDPSGRILFSEMFYEYYLSFYFSKLEWHPDYDIAIHPRDADEAAALRDTLSQARQGGFDLILYQVQDSYVPPANVLGEFCVEKLFQNDAHQLVLLAKMANCEAVP